MQEFYSFVLTLCDKVGPAAATLQENPLGGLLLLGLGSLLVAGVAVGRRGRRDA